MPKVTQVVHWIYQRQLLIVFIWFQDRYLCYYGNTDEIKNNLIENTIVGHVFLVDGLGRVRWKAHGRPTEEEIQFMIKCTEDLLKENQKNLSMKYKS